MEEGRLAGVSIASALGYLNPAKAQATTRLVQERLGGLRLGRFGELRAVSKATQLRDHPDKEWSSKTENEEYASMNRIEPRGDQEVRKSRAQSDLGSPDLANLQRGKVVVIECWQDIPCNPCESMCPQAAIQVGTPIVNTPVLAEERCTACGLCVAACPGLAIFLVDMTYSETEALVSLPHERRPRPKTGEQVTALDREGNAVCSARVVRVQESITFDRTEVVTVAVPKKQVMAVRDIRPRSSA
jgi:Fe-S-cluster-containing hydrogenase component 2